MKKTLAILLTCMLVMTLGSAMAESVAFDGTSTTQTLDISTKTVLQDATDMEIRWSAFPTVTYTWTDSKWNPVVVDGSITFTVTNNHPLEKTLKASWEDATPSPLTTYGLTVTPNNNSIFDVAGKSIAMDTPDTSGILTVASDVSSTIATGISANEKLLIGTVTFDVSSNP